MTLEHVLHRTTVHTTAGWRPFVMKRALWRLVLVSLLAGAAVSSTASAQSQPAPPIAGVIGKVQSFTGSAHSTSRHLQASSTLRQAASHNL